MQPCPAKRRHGQKAAYFVRRSFGALTAPGPDGKLEVLATPTIVRRMPTMAVARLAIFASLFALVALPCAADEPYVIPAARREHWAWKAPQPATPPAVHARGWVRNP